MPIYISKDAISNIPLAEQSLANSSSGGKLQGLIFQNNAYLVGLAKNERVYSPLKIGVENEPVKLIKLALNFINERNDIYPGYDIFELNTNSYKFDTHLENAVKKFQSWDGIANTGIVDSETLLAIDRKFLGNEFFDTERKKYIGSTSNKQLNFKQSFVNNKYEYSISLTEGGEMIKIKTNSIIKGTVVKKESRNKKTIAISPNNKSGKEILDNHQVQNTFKNNFDGNKFAFFVNAIDTKLEYNNGNTLPEPFVLDYSEEEEENTPPLLFDDDNAKLHKILKDDTLSKIVMDNYYGGGGFPIMNPYDNTVIFTLPERTPFPKEKRSEDARYQFYLNLLYYYNSEEKQGEDVKEWGVILDNNYQRYDTDHLDSVNIFNNKYDSADPESVLPNYYRFLKKMETLNPNTKIKFDSEGNTTSFKMVKGKNIRIPSRQFADSMFYFLNFRYNEMLVPVVLPPVFPGTQPTSIMDYVVEHTLDAIVNSVTSVVTEVKNDTIALYHETVDFFDKAYKFATQSLTEYWPRGAGGVMGVDANVTWAIPINTKGGIEKSLKREITAKEELTIVYSTELTLGLSLDEYQGLSINIGKNMGHGKSKKKFGIDAGVSANIGGEVSVSTEYTFPVRKDETALLTMIISVFAGTIVNSVTNILNHFEIINLDPYQYVTKMEIAFEGNASAALLAKVGSNNENGLKMPHENEESDIAQEKNKSFGGIGNILRKIPSVSSSADFNAGVSFSFKADYGTMPYTSDEKHRVFENIEIDSKLFLKGVLNTDLKLHWFQKFLVGFTPVGNAINLITNALSFDVGLMLGATWKFNRKSSPDLLTALDFTFDHIDLAELNATTNRSLKYKKSADPNNLDNNVEKELTLYFGHNTGSPDSLCESGTEVKYNLDMGVLSDMWKGDDFDYNIDTIFKLFKSIEFHKKVGYLYDKSDKKILVTRVVSDHELTHKTVGAYTVAVDTNKEVKLTSQILNATLDNISYADNFFVIAGLGLDMKMEINANLLREIFEYTLKKLYLKYIINHDDKSKQNNIEADILIQKTKILDAITKYNKNERHKTKIEGELYYRYLYGTNSIPGSSVKGLLGQINKMIEDAPDNKKPTVNTYLNVIKKYVEGAITANLYMNGEKPTDLDFNTAEILDFFSFVTDLGKLAINLEGNLGGTLGGTIKGGADLLTAGAGLDVLAKLTYEAKLYENGALTFFKEDDPLRIIYQSIRDIFVPSGADKKVEAKTVFNIVQN